MYGYYLGLYSSDQGRSPQVLLSQGIVVLASAMNPLSPMSLSWAHYVSMNMNRKENVTVNRSETPSVRVPIFPIVVCVQSAYVIGAGVGFRVESGAVALLQLDL